MKIIVELSPEELAALIVKLKEQPTTTVDEFLAELNEANLKQSTES